MLSSFLARLLGRARSFRSSRSGNVAMMFGIAAIPTVLAVGGFVDYERSVLARAQMQDALDATALALHTDAPTMTQDQMNDFATKYFAANFVNSDALDVVVSPTYDKTGPTVTVAGTAKVDTKFLPIIGINQINIGAQAVTTWGQARLRVALVLDNTLSMNDDGKMTALRTATTNLLAQLKKIATVDGDVYVSIIPFAKDVNVDKTNYSKDWVKWDWSDSKGNLSTESWDANNGSCSISGSGNSPRSKCLAAHTCSISGKTSQTSCTSAGTCSISTKTTQSTCTAAGTCSISSKTTQSTCTAAGTCSKSQYTTQSTCTSNRGTWTAGVWTTGVWTAGVWSTGVWTPAAHSTWNGCIMDRDQDYDVQNTAPDGTLLTMFPAEQYTANGGCPGKLIGLSYDWTALQKVVDGMSPAGTTNQTIGLQWGWQSLTEAPFTVPTLDPDYNYKTIIILLTDGINTENRWNAFVSTGNSAVDTRERALCTKLHSTDITIWTVQVNTGTGKNKDPTQQVLIDCASSSDKFFELTTADQIITTFDAIGKALSDLRLES
jgi:Flp pilus assembly protein TadG